MYHNVFASHSPIILRRLVCVPCVTVTMCLSDLGEHEVVFGQYGRPEDRAVHL